MIYRFQFVVVVITVLLCGCAPVKRLGDTLSAGMTHRAEGRFEVTNAPRDVGTAYYFHLKKTAFVRWIRLDTLDPINSINVYVRGHNDWDLAQAIHKPVSAGERIHINRRTDKVMIVKPSRRRDGIDHIRNIFVFVQTKNASEEATSDENGNP